MSPSTIFDVQLGLGYAPWLLAMTKYGWPRLKAMDRVRAHRAIALLHSFRFFGLVFLLPGVVGSGLPAAFAAPAAYGDFATGLLAMLALMTVRHRRLFWLLVVGFNLIGTADILVDYYNGTKFGLAMAAGELGAAYAIPIVYVPLLMITHGVAFYLLARPSPQSTIRVSAPAAR